MLWLSVLNQQCSALNRRSHDDHVRSDSRKGGQGGLGKFPSSVVGKWSIADPASLRSGFLNDVVVRKGWRDDESCQSSAAKSARMEVSLHVFRPTRTPPECWQSKGALRAGPHFPQEMRAPRGKRCGRARGSWAQGGILPSLASS